MKTLRIIGSRLSALLSVAAVALTAIAALAQTSPKSTPEKSALEKPVLEKPALGKSALETAAISASPSLTVSGIKARIEEIGAREDVEAGVRDQALAFYRTALSHLEQVEANKGAAAKFQEALQSAPARTAELKKQLADLLDPKKAEPATEKPVSQLSLAEAERLAETTQAEIATLKTELAQLDAAIASMTSRATAARAEQTTERQALDEPGGPPVAAGIEERPLVAEARKVAASAERLAREGRINLLEQELISLPARQALATANREFAAAKLDQLKVRVEGLEARIGTLRQSEALAKQAEAEQATRQLAGQNPALEEYAKVTAGLRQELTDLTRLTEQGQPALAAINADIARIKDSRTAAQEVLEIGSVGEEFGVLLREMRAQLPSDALLRKKIRDRDQAIVEERLKRLKAEESLRTLSDVSGEAVKLLASTYKPESEWQPEGDLRATVEKLVTDRRDAFEQLSAARARRIAQLSELNAAARSLQSQATQLGSLLNNRLLWLPSSAPLGRVWAELTGSSLLWLTDVESWKSVAVALGTLLMRMVVPTLLVLATLFLLIFFRPRLFQILDQSADRVGKPLADGHALTPRGLMATALLALPLPLAAGYSGWLLTRPPESSDFAGSVGSGLMVAALALYALRFLQLLAMERGVLQAHFGWSERACRVLTLNVIWLKLIALPAAFLIGMIEISNSQVYRDGLGRLALAVLAPALAVFVGRVMSPRTGIVADRLAQSGSRALWSTRGIWHPALWAVPLVLGALAVAGFYDGAVRLLMLVASSTVIITLALLAYGVAMREVLVARQRLEIKRALERRQKAREAAAEAGEAAGDALPQLLESGEIDVASVSQQIRTLLRMLLLVGVAFGLWMVWRPMLPTLGILDEVALWTQSVTTESGTKIVSVTLSNVLMGLAIGGITLIAARNLPAVLGIMLLQRLELDPGTRYAVMAVTRYSILLVGLIAAFESLGADWSQLQWVVAALSVGVGFGLQEIVANFISGLIILFERPVRVGDTVTIGEVSGTVSRIQIRATSITDWDNREILVPNKTLITDQVTNWTLTDAVTRVVLKVGIAYGSDTLLAQKIIADVVKSTPQVIDKPAPSVLFLGFGDSSLDYEVRAFVGDPNLRLQTLHDLHVGIERALRENNIEIPFPQRDVHLQLPGDASALKGMPQTS